MKVPETIGREAFSKLREFIERHAGHDVTVKAGRIVCRDGHDADTWTIQAVREAFAGLREWMAKNADTWVRVSEDGECLFPEKLTDDEWRLPEEKV